MLKSISVVVLLSGAVAWGQSPVPAPARPENTAAEGPAAAPDKDGGAKEEEKEATDETKQRDSCRRKLGRNGIDEEGVWSILGNGYAELLNTQDPQAAFSLSLLRTDALCDQLQVGVSRGSSENTIDSRSGMARFVLSPETSTWSAHVKFDKWFISASTMKFGGYVNAVLGSSNWELALDPSAPDVLTSRGIVVLSLGLGPSLGYSKTAGTNNVRILAHFGPTARVLLGDARSEKEFLDAALGSGQRAYLGVETGFWIQLNTVSVGMSLPLLVGGVDGLTNGQFLPSVSVGGKIDLT